MIRRRVWPSVAILFVLMFGAVVPTLSAEWLKYDTDHFRVIFEREDIETAAEVVLVSERVYADVTRFLDYSPRERVPVVIYGDTANANGFFTPYPPHIALFVASPTGPWLGAQTESWIELLLVHELVHYVHLTRPIGFFGALSRVFGPLTTSASILFTPGWAVEGPAVVAETAYTSGGRGRNAFFNMTWTAPIIEDGLYSYDQAGTSSAFPPAGRIYSAGYLMVDHLIQNYGPDSFVELNRRFQAAPFLGMRRALRRTTGLRANEFFDQMRASRRSTIEEQLGLPEGWPLSPVENLGVSHLLKVSPEGVYAYVRTTKEPGAVYLLDRSGASPKRLVSVAPLDVDSVSVSPDSSFVVAALDRLDLAGRAGQTGYSDVVLIDLATGRSETITNERHLFHPRASSDNRIFALERVGSYARLVEIDRAHGAVSSRYAPPERSLYTPAVSPDGTRIALVENYRGDQQIVVLETERFTELARVGAPGNAAEYSPRFVETADGYELWFGSDRSGTLALYAVTLTDAERNEGAVGRLIVQDKIGAFTGELDDDGTAVYGSYRSNGYVIRRGVPMTIQTDSSTLDPVFPAERRDEIDYETILGETRRYRDVPRPVIWLPLAAATSGTDRETEIAFGGTVRAVSNLARHELAVTALYNPADELVDGDLTYIFRPGATSWQAMLGQSHLSDREQTASLSALRPLWLRRRPLSYMGLTGLIGIEYRTVGEDQIDEISGIGALRLFSSEFGSARDMFGGPFSQIELSGEFVPDYLDNQSARTVFLSEASLQRRFAPLSAVQWLVTVAIAGESRGRALDELPYQTDRFDLQGDRAIERADTAVLGRAEIRAPIAPLDLAARGGAIRGIGAALYLEQELALSNAERSDGKSGDFTPGNFAVTGFELATDLAFNMVPFRVRGGVAARIPHNETAGSFELAGYVFLESVGGLSVGEGPNHEIFSRNDSTLRRR